jgi:hypothetical protein
MHCCFGALVQSLPVMVLLLLLLPLLMLLYCCCSPALLALIEDCLPFIS